MNFFDHWNTNDEALAFLQGWNIILSYRSLLIFTDGFRLPFEPQQATWNNLVHLLELPQVIINLAVTL